MNIARYMKYVYGFILYSPYLCVDLFKYWWGLKCKKKLRVLVYLLAAKALGMTITILLWEFFIK